MGSNARLWIKDRRGGKKKHNQLRFAAWVVHGGKRQTPIVGCSLASPNLSLRMPFKNDCVSRHAEINALSRLKTWKARRLRRSTLVVVRTTSAGELACSQPCSDCLRLIQRI